ncbi:MAG: GHKL domain-containing protein [Acetatifactor sp.]|nr:GHKL domain-containing protein [Acetatifactor sp.]MDE7045739.1 GHKL domain-containing protein [Acetatifactor sp.]
MLFQKWIDKRIEAYQSDLMRKYCDEVEAMYTRMRGWRHDYHNHIQALQASMALEKYDEVNAYLRQLNDDLSNVDTIIKTGRVMVDAILNGKINIASQNNIPVNARARIPEKAPVTDVDLCVIIGNLLDNAMEENRKLPSDDRFIRVYIGQKNTWFYLAFTNAAGKKQVKQGSLFASSKGSDHGFGLARAESIVKKYGGLFSADSEDGGFTTEILIPLE